MNYIAILPVIKNNLLVKLKKGKYSFIKIESEEDITKAIINELSKYSVEVEDINMIAYDLPSKNKKDYKYYKVKVNNKIEELEEITRKRLKFNIIKRNIIFGRTKEHDDILQILEYYKNTEEFDSKIYLDKIDTLRNFLNILKLKISGVKFGVDRVSPYIEFNEDKQNIVQNFLGKVTPKNAYKIFDVQKDKKIFFNLEKPIIIDINDPKTITYFNKLCGKKYKNLREYAFYEENAYLSVHFPLLEEDMTKEFVEYCLKNNKIYELSNINLSDDAYMSRKNMLMELKKFSKEKVNVYLANSYLMEVNNGGHEQFFLNSTGLTTFETLDALNEIGLKEEYEILKKALSIVNRKNDREKIIENIGDKNSEKLSELDEKFYQLTYNDDVIMEYIKKNKNKFIVKN